MAKYAVVSQTLSATLNGTTDFTSSGFGTVAAALVFTCQAGANSTAIRSQLSAGFYTPSAQCSGGFDAPDNVSAASCRKSSNDECVVMIPVAGTANESEYTATAITNGIRLTLLVDNTNITRACTVLLIGGCGADVQALTLNASQNGTVTSASLGFEPKGIFFFSIGGNTTDFNNNDNMLSLGFASSLGTHRAITFYSQEGAADDNSAMKFDNTRCCREITTGVGWGVEVTTWGSDTYTLTTRDAAGGDVVFALALGGDIQMDCGTMSSPTSAGDLVTTTTVEPQALFIGMTTALGTTIETDDDADGICYGLADASGQFCHGISVDDGAGTMDKNSASSNVRPINLDTAGGASLVDGTATFNVQDFTITFATVDASARQGFWVAFGRASLPPSLIPQSTPPAPMKAM